MAWKVSFLACLPSCVYCMYCAANDFLAPSEDIDIHFDSSAAHLAMHNLTVNNSLDDMAIDVPSIPNPKHVPCDGASSATRKSKRVAKREMATERAPMKRNSANAGEGQTSVQKDGASKKQCKLDGMVDVSQTPHRIIM